MPQKICIAAALLLVALAASAADLTGRVVHVQDGDTLTVLVAERQVKVRLASIDAPELRQPFGTRARQSLAEICHGKQATVAPAGTDRNGRTIGEVSCSGVPAGPEQVRRGMAWVYLKYALKDSPLFEVEAAARAGGFGLWAAPSPVPPWDWRRQTK